MKIKYDEIDKDYNQTRKADKYLTKRLYPYVNLFIFLGLKVYDFKDSYHK